MLMVSSMIMVLKQGERIFSELTTTETQTEPQSYTTTQTLSTPPYVGRTTTDEDRSSCKCDKGTATTPSPTLTCPDNLVAVTSPKTGLATFQLKFGDEDHILPLPLGQYSYIIKSSDKTCNVTLKAEDHRLRHTLELVADYTVDCSAVNSTVTWSLLADIAKQRYSIIDVLCDSVCVIPGKDVWPVLSCNGADDLQIRWPTDLVLTPDIVTVPANISQVLETSIRNRGLALDIVVLGATPPIVYPRKTANGGYVSFKLSRTCIDGLRYSDVEKKCL